ncbi:MAG: ABC transporter substrate-binding protein, partial [Dermatophilaceae bacterium]
MKNYTRAAAAVAASCVVLAGCAGTEDSTAGGDGNADLTWSMWIGSTEDQQAWQGVADLVTAENPDIEVTLQGAPWEDYWTKLGTQLSSSDPQCIVSLQGPRIGQFVSALQPLDDLVKSEGFDTSGFGEVALEGMKSDDKLWALPYDVGPSVFYYNADAFTKAGVTPKVGWTVAEFEAAAAKMSTPIMAGTAGADPLQSIALSYNGSSATKPDGTIVPDDAKFVEAMSWFGELHTKKFTTPTNATGNATDEFVAGKAMGFVGGPWDAISLAGKATFKVGMTTLPAGPGGGDSRTVGSGFGISKACDDPQAAFEAITVMTGP